METAFAATGGGFSLMSLDAGIAYVAILPLRPIADAQEASTGTATVVAAAQDAHALDGLRIMVIDDQEEARDALDAVLSSSDVPRPAGAPKLPSATTSAAREFFLLKHTVLNAVFNGQPCYRSHLCRTIQYPLHAAN